MNSSVFRIRRPLLALPDLGLWGGLLLTLSALFLTSARLAAPVPPVYPPSSSNVCTRGLHHELIISVDARNRICIITADEQFQAALIAQVSQQHGFLFTATQLQEFGKMPFIGYAITQLPAWLIASTTKRRTFSLGLPTTANNDQLSEYVAAATELYQAQHGKPLGLALRADQHLPSGQVKNIIRLLQKQGINRFNLLTEQD